MTRSRFVVFGVLAAWAVGCHPDAVTNSPVVPRAGINFANLVPDTNKLIIRVVDIVSNAYLPGGGGTFRAANQYPIAIEAGTRHIKVFFDTSDVILAQTVLLDTTYTFTQDASYSFQVGGFARSGRTPALRAQIIQNSLPTPGAGKIAVRVMSFAPSLAGAVPVLADTTVLPDAFIRKVDSLPSGSADATSLGYLASTAYAILDTGRYRVTLTAPGTTGPPIVQAAMIAGSIGAKDTNPIGGTLVAGTVMTAVIVPRSVVGSKAPQLGSPTAKKVEVITRSNDTVTVQSGTITVIINRSGSKADSITDTTGTHATTGVNRGDVVYVSGANEAEYNGWQVAIRTADSLVCKPTNAGDTATKCAAANDTAKTYFRFRYRVTGTPASPATGTPVYKVYAPNSFTDYTIPTVVYIIDKRPPDTAP